MRANRVLTGLILAMFVTISAQAADDGIGEIRTQLEAARNAGVVLSADVSASISRVLAEALESDHRGLETAALRLVIAYSDVVEVGRPAVFEIVRLYRDNEDDNVRRMAVVALGATADAWGLDFLERSLPFEDVHAVRHTIRASLAAVGADAVS
ncbi:MAG: hypothetical protein ACI9W4_002274 [Rhodothermales bacterium]|jgi:hypothetical protein